MLVNKSGEAGCVSGWSLWSLTVPLLVGIGWQTWGPWQRCCWCPEQCYRRSTAVPRPLAPAPAGPPSISAVSWMEGVPARQLGPQANFWSPCWTPCAGLCWRCVIPGVQSVPLRCAVFSFSATASLHCLPWPGTAGCATQQTTDEGQAPGLFPKQSTSLKRSLV